MSSNGKLSSPPSSSFISTLDSVSSIASMTSASSISSTPSSSTFVGSLAPLTFLARTEGQGQTSAENEIWDAVHRLYVYVATCHRAGDTERLELFRRLVRLCIRHRAILLGGVASLAADDDTTTFEACAICRRREYSTETSSQSERTTGHCCWFRPDSHARGFLLQVLGLCDNNSELFDDEVNSEEFQKLFVFA